MRRYAGKEGEYQQESYAENMKRKKKVCSSIHEM